MRTIYLDSLFILNFIIDYIIVLAAGKICALPLRRRRMAAAAAAGGLYAVLAVMFPSVLALPVVKLCVGAVIPLAAFGQGRHYPRAAISFFAVSAGFAGAVYAISGLGGAPLGMGAYIPINMRMLFVSFALCYATINLAFRCVGRQRRGALHRVELSLGGKSAALTALEDTGNELIDPVSGEAVIVVWMDAIKSLLPPDSEKKLSADPIKAYEELAQTASLTGKLRLVPYSCVSGCAVMMCIRPDSLSVDGKTSHALVGLSRTRLSGSGKYNALL